MVITSEQLFFTNLKMNFLALSQHIVRQNRNRSLSMFHPQFTRTSKHDIESHIHAYTLEVFKVSKVRSLIFTFISTNFFLSFIRN